MLHQQPHRPRRLILGPGTTAREHSYSSRYPELNRVVRNKVLLMQQSLLLTEGHWEGGFSGMAACRAKDAVRQLALYDGA